MIAAIVSLTIALIVMSVLYGVEVNRNNELSTNLPDPLVEKLFADFVVENEKNYTDDQYEFRFAIFQANLMEFEENAASIYGLSQEQIDMSVESLSVYMDLTYSERDEVLGGTIFFAYDGIFASHFLP